MRSFIDNMIFNRRFRWYLARESAKQNYCTCVRPIHKLPRMLCRTRPENIKQEITLVALIIIVLFLNTA